jgi:hypothetical protein
MPRLPCKQHSLKWHVARRKEFFTRTPCLEKFLACLLGLREWLPDKKQLQGHMKYQNRTLKGAIFLYEKDV